MADHETETLRMLRTVRDVVDVLGGTGVAATLLGIVPSAVANWLAKDCIPPSWFLQINAELQTLGCEADPSLFRQHPRLRSDTDAA